jgi:uncharacterized protein
MVDETPESERMAKKLSTKTRRAPTKRTTPKRGTGEGSAAKRAVAKRAKRRARPSPPPHIGPVNEWFELRRSPIQGVGAFALRDIPKGTRIIEYAGERIANAEADRRDAAATAARHHTFLFILSSKTVIDAAFDGNEARFINHSCDPNCQAIIEPKRIWIDAKKRIRAGTELAYDYEYDDEDYTIAELRGYGCHCGSPKCRGTIVDTKRLIER